MADHIHIACTLTRTLSQAELIEQVKTSSSKWIKTLDQKYRGFSWQRGYGVFSVSPTEIDSIVGYVVEQQTHHRGTTFEDEYRDLLQRHRVSFDERYVWD
jgi:REP element-mobilizing transposase RayT